MPISEGNDSKAQEGQVFYVAVPTQEWSGTGIATYPNGATARAAKRFCVAVYRAI